MKKVLVFTRSVLLLSTFLLILLFGGTNAKALTYDKAIALEMVTPKYTSPNIATYIKLDNTNDHISNVRSSSKHLRAMISRSGISSDPTNTEGIQMYATKKGKYKLFFDVVDGDGNYKSTEKIKVYVQTKKEAFNSFKSIKLGKIDLKKKCILDEYTTKPVDVKKSSKLKIKMNRRCKLVNLHVSRVEKLSAPELLSGGTTIGVKTVGEDINNGDMLVLSDAGANDYQIEHDGSQTYRKNQSTFGKTILQITYLDKNGALGIQSIILRSVNK